MEHVTRDPEGRGGWLSRKRFRIIGLTELAVAAVLTIGLVALFSSHTGGSGGRPQHVTLTIKSDGEHGKKGSDGKWHDAFLPADLTARAGVPVTVTVYNYDDMPHTFTAPALAVDQVIPKGTEEAPSKVTFTFTPEKRGVFDWFCRLPCDPWSMLHFGFMRGHVTVS